MEAERVMGKSVKSATQTECDCETASFYHQQLITQTCHKNLLPYFFIAVKHVQIAFNYEGNPDCIMFGANQIMNILIMLV